MKFWEKGTLRVSDNQRYLQNGSTPFFWLGDTAWLLFQNCSLEESYIYLKNRKDKGYNVIQAVLINAVPSESGTSSLPVGAKDVMNPDYWDYCDSVISMAEELGLYMALLPAWGAVVKEGFLNEDNVEEYARFLDKRYKKRPNIIWLLGGDIRASDGLKIFNRMGKILKEGNPHQLIGFHPFGRTSSSLWLHEESWLDFNMFQSGHRRYDQISLGEWDDNVIREEFFGEDSWKYVMRDHNYKSMKPTVDGEPSYEQIPQGLHNPIEPYWQACDVRRYAYWSVFQGAMGHTYGNNSIMQFYNDLSTPGSYGVQEVWKDAIHHEGSGHMTHLLNLMTSIDFINGKPAEELLVSEQKEKYERLSVFAGVDYIYCYNYSGCEFELNLEGYMGMQLDAFWYDPTSGIYSYIGKLTGMSSFKAKPVKRFTKDNDWVLVIRAVSNVGIS